MSSTDLKKWSLTPWLCGALLFSVAATWSSVQGPAPDGSAASALAPQPAPQPNTSELIQEPAPSTQLIPPPISVLREEAKKDPYNAPASLLRFSSLLMDRLKSALSSQEEAQALFQELRRCILKQPKKTTPLTQALCLDTAARLARAHSDLSPEYERLLRRTPAHVRELTETVGYQPL